jgi:dipeptide/tripeptide permease
MSRTEVGIEPENGFPDRDNHAFFGQPFFGQPSFGQPFFGQPKDVLTLSGLEVGERFSFPGMQAIPVLHFADTVAHGGMGTMAVPTVGLTWLGRGLIRAGTGLLKPDVAPIVGRLYRTDDDRRDAGFALYCMAINIGTFAGPRVIGRLGDRRGLHWSFSAAAVGMTLGLVQYAVGRRHLAGRKHAAEFAPAPDAMRRAIRLLVTGLVAAAALAALLAAAGQPAMDRFVATLWVRMGRSQPHPANKIAIGVGVLGGLPFLQMVLMVLPTSGHLLCDLGDVLLETSGISATTKLAPAASAGRTMPLWSLSLTLANGVQAQTVKLYDDVSKPATFGVNGPIAVTAGPTVMATARRPRRTMHPVH